MIRSVRISGFKRFRDAEFRLPGHAVLTGANDTGKTTLLQAVASWALALRRWRDLGDFKRRNGYRRAPIARQAFVTVPLRSYDLLWLDRRYRGTIEIELRHDAGWSVTMEFIADTTEQIYVRPGRDAPPDTLREVELDAVFVPPMTGVGLEEPLLLPPTIEHTLGLGRSGAVLRNVLAAGRTLKRRPAHLKWRRQTPAPSRCANHPGRVPQRRRCDPYHHRVAALLMPCTGNPRGGSAANVRYRVPQPGVDHRDGVQVPTLSIQALSLADTHAEKQGRS